MRHAIAVALLAAGLSACSLTATEEPPGTADGGTRGTVVLVTHESFSLPKKVVEEFERQSGYDLEVRASGDAGTLTTELAVTADNPTGDVAFGVDNTFASRALDEGVFAETGIELPVGAEAFTVPGDDGERMVPVDTGSVCVNVDTGWFREHDLDPPATLDDLTDPAYDGLFVTPSALSSSPGLAFLLATVAEYGDDWPAYWEDLLANDLRIVDGWSDAYYTDFTAGGGGGDRPIVLSYDSSPAFTVPKGGGDSTTAALLDTCFQQVEYAGVLDGAAEPEAGRELVEFLLSPEVQEALPDSMYVFPVVEGTPLPDAWQEHAVRPTDPYVLDPAEIAENRDDWLQQWRDLVTQ